MGDERIGSDVAGFTIESVLGQGGMGTVYVAEQSSPRRRVALKLLRPELSSDEAFRRRFEHESEAAASTEHPNIVPIYASGQADGVLYIAMRYVAGSDLRRTIAEGGRVDAERAVEIVSQVASALDAAHHRGLVHRDVKPGNILLDEHGNAYLSDFGLIKRSEISTGITRTGQFMGSVEYCAPEQIRGEAVDGRADVYSLACVLYECLAGTSPFRRDSEIATLYAHLEQAPPALPPTAGAPPDLDRVLSKAMAKRPDERYATAGDFARDARGVVGVTSGEREIATAPRSWRRSGLIAAAAALVLAAVVAVIAAVAGGEGTPSPGAAGARGAVVTNTLQRIDPETGDVTQSIGDISFSPETLRVGGTAAGEGGVWVAHHFSAVQHVDPITSEIRATVSINSYYLVPLVAFRTVWIGTEVAVERINPATDELLRPIRLDPITGIAVPAYLATVNGSVWAAQDRTLYRIDPVTNVVANRISLPGSTGIAGGEGAVWVIDALSGTLTKIDPSAGDVVASTTVPGNLDHVSAGGGAVWVLDAHVGTVSIIDPESLAVRATVRVGDDEQEMTFGAGAAWLADGEAASITKIEPLTQEATTFPMGGPVADVAVDQGNGDQGNGSVWVLLARVG